jgi:REP element-mobilizing transposase RayT
MARRLRPYSPGGFFHLTARTQGRAEWFDETLRDHICDTIAIVQQRCDLRIVAFVVMPNHLHLVVQQGDHALVRFMHPVLCSIAARVKTKYQVAGHVFERRYWSYPCSIADYLTSCIEYVHRNPVKALLCQHSRDYKWSSYAAYDGRAPNHSVAVEPLTNFHMPDATPSASLPISCNCICKPTRDLGDVVDHVLRRFDPPIDLRILRNVRGVLAAKVRAECIKAGALAGYRNVQIARYLNVSDSVVSQVVVRLRQTEMITAAFQDEPKCEDKTQARKK